MKIGVTGHQRLEDPTRWMWVEVQLDHVLARSLGNLTGVTSLAAGADQLFAQRVIDRGGAIEVIVPFAGYERTFTSPSGRLGYESLLRSAARVETLERRGSDEEAFFAAGKRVVDVSELVVAVWNGKPAAGLGGTGDVVRYAREKQKGVIHMNPLDLTVSEL